MAPPPTHMTKYLQLLRVNHWFKNLIVLIGVYVAMPDVTVWLSSVPAFFLASIISSVNYVINQISDREFDAHHPEKKTRPIPMGLITVSQAIIVAGILLSLSLALARLFYSPNFFWTLVVLFIAGIIYNVKPFRTKDIPYLDVISESFNNPVRFLLGWFVVLDTWPPLQLLLFTWAFGALFMTAKRYDELVFYGKKLGPYRSTFNTYTPSKLQALMIFYSLTSLILLYLLYPWASLPLACVIIWFIAKVKSGQARARDIEHFIFHPFASHK